MKKKKKYILGIASVILVLYTAVTGIHQGTILYQLIQIFTNFNNILLLCYACAFLLVYVLYQTKKRIFDTGSILYLIYVMSAFGSCWYYSQDKVDTFYPNITLTPLLFLFITINICLLPLWKLDTKSIKGIDDSGIASILNILSISFIILSIPPLLSLIGHFSPSMLEGSYLASMYEESEDKAALYFSGISKLCFAFIRRFENIVIILFFYQLYKRKENYAIGLIAPIFMFFLFKLMSGSRGGLVGSMLLFICLYFLLRNLFSNRVRQVINMCGTLLGFIFIGMLAAISISRFSQQNTNSDITIDRWISQYMGESSVRFTDTAWYTDKFMYGNQNFIFVRKVLGLPYISDYNSFMSYYEGTLHFPVNVFYTFMGDIYLDFGLFGSIMYAILFYFMFELLIKKKRLTLTIPRLIVLSIVFNYLGIGFAANVYRTIFIQQDMIWLFILAISLKIIQGMTVQNYPKFRDSNGALKANS